LKIKEIEGFFGNILCSLSITMMARIRMQKAVRRQIMSVVKKILESDAPRQMLAIAEGIYQMGQLNGKFFKVKK
jgi:hypothetical protein